MQAAVAKLRTFDADEKNDVTTTSRITFLQRTNDDDLLDDNDVERILSRPTIPRRKLDLFEAPEFVQRLSGYQEATVGDTVTFSGQYKAFPKPTVKWFKDEEEVTETKRHKLDLSSDSDGIVRLIIQEVVKQDEGAYKCKVENQEGVASTTGYLSVSGKSTEKSHSLQTKKLAQDRVSTPPYLRPIVEQKSMEEREEKEYQCLPPSPLQQFMDKIRHSAKSMHGPIVYADMADFYSDEDIIKDFEEDTEEDVFDEEQSSPTPSGSPVEEISLEDALEFHNKKTIKNNSRIHVFDEFVSPSVDLRATSISVQTSNEESSYDSDNQGILTTTSEESGTVNNLVTSTNLKNRRMKLMLQRSPHALEISESDATLLNTAPQLGSISQDDTSSRETNKELKVMQNTHITVTSKMDRQEILAEAFERLIDHASNGIASPWIQVFAGFVTSITALSLAVDIPLAYMLGMVALLSIIIFQILEHQQKSK